MSLPRNARICLWDAFGDYSCQRAAPARHIDPYSPPAPPADRKFGGPGRSAYEFFADETKQKESEKEESHIPEPFTSTIQAKQNSSPMPSIASSSRSKETTKSKETFVYTADGQATPYQEVTRRKGEFVFPAPGTTSGSASAGEPEGMMKESFCGCSGAKQESPWSPV